jgi:type IV fimbrial biogenesis protein FimT
MAWARARLQTDAGLSAGIVVRRVCFQNLQALQESRRQRGFTLLELLITLVVAAIVLSAGIPSFDAFLATNRMAAAANNIVSSVHAARSEAIKRRTTITWCASEDWNTANPGCALGGGLAGWIIFADENGDVSVNGADTVLFTHAPLPDGIVVAIDPASLPYLQFANNGFPQDGLPGAQIGNVQLCDQRGDADTGDGVAAGRWIQIAATGRPQLYRLQADVQANPLGGC